MAMGRKAKEQRQEAIWIVTNMLVFRVVESRKAILKAGSLHRFSLTENRPGPPTDRRDTLPVRQI
jgi:hypothetical protein